MSEYISRKISICKELVQTAISEAQKEIYQGYLEFWQNKIINEPESDINFEELFLKENPQKRAYYKRNGVIYKTNAFKEFLELNNK